MTNDSTEVADGLILLDRILDALHSWSGVTAESPDHTEVLNGGPLEDQTITVGDLRDAFVALDVIRNRR